MAIDFEAEGLLEGLDGPERQARLELLQELSDAGVPLEELRAAIEEDRLSILPVERALEGGGKRYTGPQVAEKTGVELDFLLRNREALGLPVSDPSEPVFSDEDVKAGQMLKLFKESGLPEDGILEVSRVIGMNMARIAEASRILFAETLIQPGDTELDVGRRFAGAAPHLRGLAAPILSYAFNLHLLELVRRDVLGRGDVSAGQLPQIDVAVCFADMVGFTKLGERLETEQLGGLGGRLGQLAAAISRPPVRVVKQIGDAVMLVSPEAQPLLEAALGLVEAADAEGEGFPQLRAGVAHGPAIGRGGDWYGRPVNLASRVTGIARPGSVLATAEAREAAGDGYAYSFAGGRHLKGITGEVKLFRVRREDA